MDISVIGTGYVGLVNGACLAHYSNKVTCIDIDERKISSMNNGIIPIYEPNLDTMISDAASKKNLFFSSNYEDIKDSDIVFIAVGTPQDEDGSADLKYVLAAARELAKHIKDNCIVVVKSTVPVGTCNLVKQCVTDELKAIGREIKFHIASNPEFLKEGSAIDDCLYPDRIVIGTEDVHTQLELMELYRPWSFKNTKLQILSTDIKSSEMIKYTSNAMLATRISFINEIANLCEKVGANIEDVSKGVGMDSRIGDKFLKPGCGYGGSCFPKDVKALIKIGEEHGEQMYILNSVEEVNYFQKRLMFRKLWNHFNGNLNKKTIAILGLAFKPNTDDMREATSLVLIDMLLQEGCNVKVYDPIAMKRCKEILGDKVQYCEGVYQCILGADATLLVTEWDEFKNIPLSDIKRYMNGNVLIDGRNVYDKDKAIGCGLVYDSIGR
jgi:UDPglucose 6-dehydrogenase